MLLRTLAVALLLGSCTSGGVAEPVPNCDGLSAEVMAATVECMRADPDGNRNCSVIVEGMGSGAVQRFWWVRSVPQSVGWSAVARLARDMALLMSPGWQPLGGLTAHSVPQDQLQEALCARVRLALARA